MFWKVNRESTMFRGVLVVMALAAVSLLPAFAQGNAGRFGPPSGRGTAVAALSAEEAQELAYMREEEKMARDLYNKLAEKWNLRVFDRIADSEQRHFDAVGRLLTRYNIPDPALDMPEGKFKDASLQALYDELLAKGSISVKDALEVGALVEKTDIADLEEALKTATNAEVKRVFTSLLQGSMNHLDAFEACLELVNQ
mgnify:CR=1 FL=1